MGLFARAMAISFGILAGGGVGFYYRETYHAAAVENKCDKAEARLRELVMIRKSKEKRLEELKAKSAWNDPLLSASSFTVEVTDRHPGPMQAKFNNKSIVLLLETATDVEETFLTIIIMFFDLIIWWHFKTVYTWINNRECVYVCMYGWFE